MTQSASWNLIETIYFLCTIEHQKFPRPDAETLAPMLRGYDDERGHGLYRSPYAALVHLILGLENGHLSVADVPDSGADLESDLGSILQDRSFGPIDPDYLTDLVDCRFDEATVRLFAVDTAASSHFDHDEFLAEVEGRHWIELHQAARLVLVRQPNGTRLNAFIDYEGWIYRDHPIRLTAFSEDGIVLHAEARVTWEAITSRFQTLMLSGELVAESNGRPVPGSLWQTSYVDWWKSQLVPMPIVRLSEHGVPEISSSPPKERRAHYDLLVNRGLIEVLMARGEFDEVSQRNSLAQTSASPGMQRRPSEKKVQQVVLSLREGFPDQPAFDLVYAALKVHLPNAGRNHARSAWKEVFYPNTSPKPGPKLGSKRQ